MTAGSIALGENTIAGLADINVAPPGVPAFTTGKTLDEIRYHEREEYRYRIGKANNIAMGTGAEAAGGRIISIGEYAGAEATDGNWNVTNVNIGRAAGARSVGEDNVFMGTNAGGISNLSYNNGINDNKSNSGGGGVTDTGEKIPGLAGARNVALGLNAGASAGRAPNEFGFAGLTTGDTPNVVDRFTQKNEGTNQNVFIGESAGQDLKAGSSGNVLIGSGAGKGLQSIANGHKGKNYTRPEKYQQRNGAPLQDVANIGAPALIGLNVGIGPGTLNGATGDMNVAMGWQSSEGIVGSSNVSIGGQAMQMRGNAKTRPTDLSTGVGYSAGQNMTGLKNTAIGAYANSYGPDTLINADDTTAIGASAKASADQATAVGRKATATAEKSLAAAYKANATGEQAVAVGSEAEATAEAAIAIGAKGKKKDDDQNAVATSASGKNAIAIGTASTVSGNDSISVGRGNTVTGNNSGAFGDPNTISGTGSFAFGNDNTIAKNNTFVLGNNVTATQDNSVILGNLSTDRAATAENSATVNNVTYNGFAGVGSAEKGVVSVGDAGKERQIINVAAGAINKTSTDAINGSQLWNIFDQGGITFSNGTVTTDGKPQNASKLVKFGDTVKFDGKGDIKVDFDADSKTYTISGPTTQPQVTVPTYTVGAGKTNTAEGITLNGDDGNNRVDIIGKADGAIETSVKGRNVEIDLTSNTKEDIKKGVDADKTLKEKGITYTGDKDSTNAIKLGETLNVKGNADPSKLTDKNIGVEASGSQLLVKLAKEINLGEGGQVKMENKAGDEVTLNGDGLKVSPKVSSGDQTAIIINKDGIDAGNHGITNVKSGIPDGKKLSEVEGDALNNAANVGDLQKAAKAAKTEVVGEKQAIVSGKEQSDGHMKYTVSATKTTVTNGSDKVSVTGGEENAQGVLAYTVDLSEAAKTSLSNADSALQSWIAQANGTEVKTVKKDDNTLNFVNGDNIKITNDNGKVKVATSKTPSFESGTVENAQGDTYITEGNKNIVNGGDVYKAIHATNSQYQGDNTDVTVKRNPDQILGVKGGATATELTENNIGTVGAADGSITVKLAKNLTKLSSVAIENGPTISSTGIDMGDKPITNLKMNEKPNGKDAVNVEYLEKAIKGATPNVGKFGLTADDNGEVKKDLDQTIAVNGDGTNITTSTEADKGVKVSLKKDVNLGADGSVTTGDTKIENGGLTITGGPSVKKDGINAGDKKITNVTDGQIAKGSKDAVNGGQLHDVKELADGKLGDFTVGADKAGKAAGITVDKDNKRFDIVAGSEAVTTEVSERTVKVDLSQDSKNGIKDGKDAKVKVDAATFGLEGESGDAVKKKLNQTIKVVGADKNITTKTEGEELKIELAKTLDLGTDGSVTTGDTVVNNKGVTTPKVTTGKTTVEAGKVMGLDDRKPGDTNITDYGTGANATRAATEGAVKAVDDKVTTNTGDISKLKNGWKLKATKSEGEVSGDAETPVEAEELVEIDAGKNIKLTQATRKITVATKDVVEFTSATFGTGTDKTVINKDGVTITEGEKTVSLTDGGLNNGGNKITNVAKGTEGTDAVNKSQLDEAVKGAKGKPTSVKAGDANVSVEKSKDANAEGGAEYVVKLADKVALGTADNKVTVDGTNGTVTVGGDNGTKIEKEKITGLEARTPASSDYGVNGNEGRAATEGAVKAVDDKVNTNVTNIAKNTEALNKGLDFSGDVASDTKNIFNRKLGEETKVVGGQTDKDKLSDNNIGVVSNGTDTLTVKLAKELSKLTSAQFEAKDGSTTEITGSAITSTDSTGEKIAVRTPTETSFIGGDKNDVTLSNNGLDNGNNKIVNVAPGEKDTDAVNVSQLKPVKEAVEKGLNFEGDYDTDGAQVKNTFKRELGEAVSVTGGADHDDLSNKNIGVVSDGAGGLAVKLAKNIDLTDGGSVTMGDTLVNKDGVTITGGPSITKTNGVDAGNKVIKNVAPGKAGTDAVNKDQLEKAITDSAYGFTVSDGEATNKVGVASGKDVNFKGADGVTVTRTGDAGQDQKFEIGLGNEVTIGKDGKDGKPGKIGVAGQDGKPGVAIDGKDGGTIVVGGADGKAGKDGVDGKPGVAINGKDGSIGLSGKDGKSTITVAPGKPGLDGIGKDGVDGANGKTETRIVYTNKEGKPEEVANLNDGLMFQGNNTDKAVIKKKLNTVMTIKGENDGTSVSGANMYVENDGTDLIVKMAKDLTDLDSVTVGAGDKATKIDGTNGNITVGGSEGTKIEKGKITGLEARDTSSEKYGEGENANRAATESAVKGVNDKVATNTTNIETLQQGWKLEATKSNGDVEGGKEVAVKAKDKVEIDAGKNIKLTQTDKKISISTKDEVEFKSINLKDGSNETKLTTTDNGLDVGGDKIGNVASGLGGSKLSTATGDTLKNAANIGDLQNAVNDIKGAENGGFGLTDDNGKAVKQDLGKQIQIKGKDGVTVTADEGGAKVLEVALNGDVKVGGKDGNPGSIGVKGEDGKDGTTITKDAIVFNGVDGVNGKNGVDGKDGQASIKVEKGAKGLNGNDGKDGESKTRIVYEKPNGEKEQVATLNDGLKFKGNGDKTVDKKLNDTVTIKGGMTDLDDDKATAKNTRVDVDEKGNLVVKLAKNLEDLDKVVVGGKDGKAGKDGVDGKPGVAINGKDGSIGLTGKAGDDGVTPKADITLENGQPGVNGADGTHMTRIVYEDKDGKHEVATMDDGLKYVGDVGKAAIKLNKTTTVVGGVTEADKLSDNNIGVVAEQKDGDAKLTIKLAKDLTGLTSVTTTDADGNKTVQNGNGVTITPDTSKDENKDKKPVSLTKDGLNNGGNQITNVKSGGDINDDKNANNAANIGDLKNATTNLTNTGWKLQTNANTEATVKLGDTVQVVDGVNTKVSSVTTVGGKHTYHVDVTGLPVAYTDEKGEPLVKVGDKFYKPDQIDPATGLPKADAKESTPAGTTLVNKDGAKDPQTLDGVKSAIDDAASGKDYATQLADAAEASPNKAVNVKDLKNATDNAVSTVTSKGFGLSADDGKDVKQDLGTTIKVKGENGIETAIVPVDAKQPEGTKALQISLGNKVDIGGAGKDGADGKDGKLGVNGKDGKTGVAIDGAKGSIGLTGPAGVNGEDGKPAVATTTIKVQAGKPGLDGIGKDGVDGADGKTETRIVYTDKKGEPQEVANLNDGLMFQGNNTEKDVIKKKLNTVMTIKGGFAPEDGKTFKDTTTAANNYVENDGENLVIRMAKKLTDLESAVFGKDPTSKDSKAPGVKVDGATGAITSKNADGNTITINNGKGQITGVESGLKGDDPNKPIKLSDATGDTLNNAANIGDLKNAVSNVTDAANGGGFGLKGQDGKEIKQNLGTTVEVVGNGGVITKVVDMKADPNDPKSKDHQALEISLGHELSVGGKDGKDGSIGVNGKDGKTAVAINGADGGSIVVGGKDGKIGVDGKDGAPGIALNGKDGSIGVAGKDGANADITTSKGDAFLGGKGDDGKDGKDGTRITYQPKDKDGNPVGKPKQVATMDDGIAYKGDTGEANVKLNKVTNIVGGVKDADKLADGNIGVVAEQDGDNAKLTVKLAKELKGLDKVTFGPVDKDGKPTEKDPKKVVSVGKDGINAGSKVITNVAEGKADSDAVNVKQLNAKVSDMGWNINTYNKTDEGDISPVKNDKTVKFGSADGSIKVSHEFNKEDGNVKVDLALGNDVNIGGPGADGKPGKDGKLGVNGKDGKTGVAIDGANGTIGLTGPAGQDGKNPNAVIGVKDGAPGLDGNDGKDGASKTRVVYTKPDGKVEEVATLNDGVKYEGDQGKAAVKLNQTTKVVGGAKGELTDGNIGVVASQDGKNAKLTVKLAKDLKGINSVEAKDVTVKQGGNLKVERGANVDMGGNQVKNIASGISGKSYRNPKDNNAANIGDVKAIANQAVAPLNKRINDVDKHASAGTASAMAAAGLPQAYLPGHSMVAVGAGTHRGQNAIAVGVSRISDSGHVVIKLNGATNSKGDTSGSVGVGYQW
ncbi:YadA-like family protein [Spirabiliibacterium mucosae]|uniref:YadA-like family protein n=1 Tax=Spirabiliibacterium mucosae TaxID=28156 RepID=UPI0031F467B5